MNDKHDLLEALNDIDALRLNMEEIERLITNYTIDTPDNESKRDFGNVISTLSDCLEMYLARLNIATQRAFGYYFEKNDTSAKTKDEYPILDVLGGYPYRECFGLQVVDDGFAPNIWQNDTVIVHRQSDIKDGELAVVQIGENKPALLRRVHRNDCGMILTADNNAGKRFEPIMIGNDEIPDHITFLGKVITSVRTYDKAAKNVG